MEFVFNTLYNQQSLTAMAKAVRKTVRKKHSTKSHIFGWCIIAIAVLFAIFRLKDGFELSANLVVTLLAALVLFFALLFEDSLNAAVSRRRMLRGTEKAITTFNDKCFISETELGKTEWNYDKILMLAETKEYFVFIFSNNHAQLYDKNSIRGGNSDEFRQFITCKVEKDIIYIS